MESETPSHIDPYAILALHTSGCDPITAQRGVSNNLDSALGVNGVNIVLLLINNGDPPSNLRIRGLETFSSAVSLDYV
eukprot:4812282-Amphidinium_carterae.1